MTAETTAAARPTADPAAATPQQQQQPAAATGKAADAFTAFRDYDDPAYNEDDDEDYNDDDEDENEDDDSDEDAEEGGDEDDEVVTQEEANELLKDGPLPDARKILRGGKVLPDPENVEEITSKVKGMFEASMPSAAAEPR